jgi:DNA polymerase
MRDTYHDLETFSPTPIKNGTHIYAEQAEVMLWSFADGDGTIYVWDAVNSSLHWQEELSGVWESNEVTRNFLPQQLMDLVVDDEALVWFQNGGQFDFVVLKHAMPEVLARIPMRRWRDTMVQAFAHSLPGALEKLGDVLNISEDKRKLKEGKRLVQLFCKPQGDAFFEKHGTRRATKQTHPAEWQRFIEYAGGDITTMREARRLMPQWNYKGSQIDLWHLDLRINYRGFAVDLDLANAAVEMAEKTKDRLAKRTQELTDGAVEAATQRDALLAHILEIHGVSLPDMQADTLERRMRDPDLPDAVRELLGVRLQASMNSVSKYKTLLRGVSSDGRLRGTMQFRGAGRTGRVAHRLFQPGNLPRTWLAQRLIELAIEWVKSGYIDEIELAIGEVMQVLSNTIRGSIVAEPGKKLVVADLANIEGRMAAWLAGEEWKLQAFRDYDTVLGVDAKGKKLRKGADLYILAYAKSFNVPPESVPEKGPERQIGKVEELMFQYGGGVGAWITGAATYGIDLNAMTEQVWGVLPDWAKDEAEKFLRWLYEGAETKLKKAREKAEQAAQDGGIPVEEFDHQIAVATAAFDAAKFKARHGLPEKTFIACDAIKRLWRKAHPAISSYWKELEDTVKTALINPGVTYPCRRVKIRRDGAWLRIGLPSGRALCYPNPKVNKAGSITYTGFNQYTNQWGEISTYGGKLFENITQAAACDQLLECGPAAEAAGYDIVLSVHDEYVTETPDEDRYSADELGRLMCSDLGWNAGLPLAAAGFETYRYKKE